MSRPNKEIILEQIEALRIEFDCDCGRCDTCSALYTLSRKAEEEINGGWPTWGAHKP